MKHIPPPAFGADQQPFAGITTIMRQPATRDLDGVDVAVVGIPYDSGTSYRSGTRFGPRKIREASALLWGYNPVLKVDPLQRLRLVDYGDVSVIPVDIEANNAAIEAEVGAILETGAAAVALGGDHSISLPLIRAHARNFGPLAVVHFDSHPDTWDREFGQACPYSHGTPFRRALEEGLIDPDHYIQVGIRGPVSGPEDYADARRLGAEIVTIGEAFELGIPAVTERIHTRVAGKPVYISLDIDSADPAYAPGTGTPEVGGFTSFQLLQLVRGLDGLDLTGFDLVEVNPLFDHGDITAILAANLVFEYLSVLALAGDDALRRHPDPRSAG
ncbi:MAG TPA: agmatinase [Anaerolineales bacterium]|nr:agmatinase [Anaerolineales bacterium]